jgi:hypothetical protein
MRNITGPSEGRGVRTGAPSPSEGRGVRTDAGDKTIARIAAGGGEDVGHTTVREEARSQAAAGAGEVRPERSRKSRQQR